MAMAMMAGVADCGDSESEKGVERTEEIYHKGLDGC
jgi:hypothetical protein